MSDSLPLFSGTNSVQFNVSVVVDRRHFDDSSDELLFGFWRRNFLIVVSQDFSIEGLRLSGDYQERIFSLSSGRLLLRTSFSRLVGGDWLLCVLHKFRRWSYWRRRQRNVVWTGKETFVPVLQASLQRASRTDSAQDMKLQQEDWKLPSKEERNLRNFNNWHEPTRITEPVPKKKLWLPKKNKAKKDPKRKTWVRDPKTSLSNTSPSKQHILQTEIHACIPPSNGIYRRIASKEFKGSWKTKE